MRKYFFIAFLFSILLNGAAQETQSYKIEVGQFNKLKVTDDVNVVYRCNPDSTGFVQYRGRKEFADAFIITPKNGQLRIQVSTEDVGNPDLPVLYVYSDFLSEVENSSNFSTVIENPSPCAVFKARQVGNGSLTVDNIRATKVEAALATGNGTINVSGSCTEAMLKMVGTGTISADRLPATKVQCMILGGGTIGCYPKEMLNVKGIGSTKIYYKGDPMVKKTGGGKIFPLPSSEETGEEISVEETYPHEIEIKDE